MIIDIDDSISGEERKRILRLGPVKYALDLFDGNREKTSKWLNISDRTLRNYIIEDSELFKYKNNKRFIQLDTIDPESLLSKFSDKQMLAYADDLEIVKNRPSWKHINGSQRDFLIRKLVYIHSKKNPIVL